MQINQYNQSISVDILMFTCSDSSGSGRSVVSRYPVDQVDRSAGPPRYPVADVKPVKLFRNTCDKCGALLSDGNLELCERICDKIFELVVSQDYCGIYHCYNLCPFENRHTREIYNNVDAMSLRIVKGSHDDVVLKMRLKNFADLLIIDDGRYSNVARLIDSVQPEVIFYTLVTVGE